MAVRTNTAANFVGQTYVATIALIMLPLYLRELGAEAYGLVGFFVMLQSWLRMLDMGLSPAAARQISHARGLSDAAYRETGALVRAIESLFIGLAALSSIIVWNVSPWIAAHWLHFRHLALSEVTECVMLMGLAASLRWLAAFYRSAIQGMERQVWLNGANMVIATFRYFGALMLLVWVTHDPRYFFGYEVGVSLGETALLNYGLHRLLPRTREQKQALSLAPLTQILPFAAGTAYAALVWIVLTQADKLILSHVLPLWEYGYFALVALIAGGLITLAGPVSTAVLPRMTWLLAQGQGESMLALYRQSTQIVAVVVLPLSALVAMLPRDVIFAWTGDHQAARWAAPMLVWLALGNAVLALNAFQYYLQYAHGKVAFHVMTSTVDVVIQTPVIVFAAYHFGAYGAALAWFILRTVSFVVWSPIVHRIFAPGIHKKWLLQDIGPIAIASGISAVLAGTVRHMLVGAGRFEVMLVLASLAFGMLVMSAMASSVCRPYLLRVLTRIGTAHG
ncbi:MAG: oligosaccharide flippase family protein [Betaproteobacteria bacterium]|nr:oligosaccharide flippase family protein [Betaproteobacteria bacterium]